MSEISDNQDWYLQGYVDSTGVPTRFPLSSFPVRIGRRWDLEIAVPIEHVSGVHAQIDARNGQLWLRDLGSSNGTRLNHEPVEQEVALSHGDVLHFAGMEFVLERAGAEPSEHLSTCMMSSQAISLARGPRAKAHSLRKLLDKAEVTPVFQPIVSLDGCGERAFELLARGARRDLPESPLPLFEIAEAEGLSAELSAVFRDQGVKAGAKLPGSPRIFFNAHPSEVGSPMLIEALVKLRDQLPNMALTLEVHEATVTDSKSMAALRAALNELRIGLAYDDFGSGQARLLELTESPPDILKFDVCLIRNLDVAASCRKRLVARLVDMVKDIGIRCLAEGIERQGELDACREIGFEFAQGYLLGQPSPVEAWASVDEPCVGSASKRSAQGG